MVLIPLRLFFSEGIAFEFNLGSVMEKAVADGVGDGGVLDVLVPFFERALTGDDRGGGGIPILNNLQEIRALGFGQWSQQEVVNDEKLNTGEFGEGLEVRAIGSGLMQGLKEPWSAEVKNGVSGSRGQMSESAGNEALADSGRTRQKHVAVSSDPLDIGEV